MNRTISILAALAATVILIAPADAKRIPIGTQLAPSIDVAAAPAYPLSAEAAHASKQARGHRRAGKGNRRYTAPRALAGEHDYATGSGVVRSRKTGATARVSASFAPIAQAVVDAMEARGASIKFMGGYRKGPCASYSLHPCGQALDLCQLGRGVVDRRCNMPSRAVEIEVARAHGAYSGGVWCNQDRGHIQMLNTASSCGGNLYSAVSKFKHRASRTHWHVRLAHR